MMNNICNYNSNCLQHYKTRDVAIKMTKLEQTNENLIKFFFLPNKESGICQGFIKQQVSLLTDL